jgi:hypothetical protein
MILKLFSAIILNLLIQVLLSNFTFVLLVIINLIKKERNCARQCTYYVSTFNAVLNLNVYSSQIRRCTDYCCTGYTRPSYSQVCCSFSSVTTTANATLSDKNESWMY